jgi:hypothetical protein
VPRHGWHSYAWLHAHEYANNHTVGSLICTSSHVANKAPTCCQVPYTTWQQQTCTDSHLGAAHALDNLPLVAAQRCAGHQLVDRVIIHR